MSEQATIDQETAELMRRTDLLAPLYDLSRSIFVWGFRIGAALLVLGVLLAIVTGDSIKDIADPLGEIPGAILSGKASGGYRPGDTLVHGHAGRDRDCRGARVPAAG